MQARGAPGSFILLALFTGHAGDQVERRGKVWDLCRSRSPVPHAQKISPCLIFFWPTGCMKNIA